MNYEILTDYNSIDINKWAEFVKNHPDGNAFQTPEMFRIYKSAKFYEPVVIICEDEITEIQGLIVSVIQREFSGVLGKLSSRSIIWGAPLIKGNNPEILNILLKGYDNYIKKKAVYTQIRNLWDTEELKNDFEKCGYIYEDHLNILIDLTKSEEILWKEIYSRRRSQINKSERKGISVKIFDEPVLVEESYNILLDVYERAKLPLPGREFFKEANKILAEKGYLKFFGAFYNDRIVGVMYLLCYNGRTYEWYIGSYLDYMRMHPNDLVIWEILKWGKENGYRIFDFGGAGRPDREYGVREYKKKFGGATLNLGRYQKVHNRFLMNISVVGFKIWQFFKFGFRTS
jgi:lipid II:glycine glycyltransferase (peptidoglycan interpeptide bridge formation enzyme)